MMRILYPLALCILLFAGACSYLFPPRSVECCENKASCCFDQMCCLPRYAKAAGVEPKPFTTNIPVYGAARPQDLEPPPGAVIIKKSWLAKLNPFGGGEERPQPQAQPQDQTASAGAEPKEKESFWARWNPFGGPTEPPQPQDNTASTDASSGQKEEKGFWARWLPF